MKTYIIKYEIHEEIEADSEFDALLIHQDYLSEKLGSNVDSFSYPEGQEAHYNDEVISVLKKYGIKICPSAIDGVVDGADDNFNLKRIMVGFWGRKFPFEEYYNDLYNSLNRLESYGRYEIG